MSDECAAEPRPMFDDVTHSFGAPCGFGGVKISTLAPAEVTCPACRQALVLRATVAALEAAQKERDEARSELQDCAENHYSAEEGLALKSRAEKAEAELASCEAAFARWKEETRKDVEAIDRLNAHVARLREALTLGIAALADAAIDNEVCGAEYRKVVDKMRAALAATDGKKNKAALLERFPRKLWPDGPGGGPYTDKERAAQREHTAKWLEQEKDCTCHVKRGDWFDPKHRDTCPRAVEAYRKGRE